MKRRFHIPTHVNWQTERPGEKSSRLETVILSAIRRAVDISATEASEIIAAESKAQKGAPGRFSTAPLQPGQDISTFPSPEGSGPSTQVPVISESAKVEGPSIQPGGAPPVSGLPAFDEGAASRQVTIDFRSGSAKAEGTLAQGEGVSSPEEQFMQRILTAFGEGTQGSTTVELAPTFQPEERSSILGLTAEKLQQALEGLGNLFGIAAQKSEEQLKEEVKPTPAALKKHKEWVSFDIPIDDSLLESRDIFRELSV